MQVTAGSLESNDALIVLQARPEGTLIEIESIVKAQFGPQIEATVQDMLHILQLHNVLVRVQDKGAYDCTLRARLETAALRWRQAQPDQHEGHQPDQHPDHQAIQQGGGRHV